MKRSLTLASLMASMLVLTAPGIARAEATGDLWEVTTQMAMEGMPAGMGMPAQTRQVCSAKEWTKPPVQNDHNCQFTDFQHTATKATWKMSCEGMSGEGEITRTSADAYKGWMKMTMPQGAMTMNLAGRRLGDCDAGEAKKARDAQIAHVEAQVAAGQKTAADAMKQTCTAPSEALDLRQFHQYETTCTGELGHMSAAEYKAPMCAKLNSYDGFKTACKRNPDDENSFDALAKFCGTTVEAVSSSGNCAMARKSEDTDIMSRCCPAEAAAYASEKCAGLSYSTAGALGHFCGTFAKDLMDANKSGAAAPAKKRTGKSGR